MTATPRRRSARSSPPITAPPPSFSATAWTFCCNGCRTIDQGCRDAGAARTRCCGSSTRCSTHRPAPRRASRPGSRPRSSATSSPTTTPTCARRFRCCSSTPGDRQRPRRAAWRAAAHRRARRARRRGDDRSHGEGRAGALPLHPRSRGASQRAIPLPRPPFGSVENPIRLMENEHRFVGDAMAEIRALTDGYRCLTMRAHLPGLFPGARGVRGRPARARPSRKQRALSESCRHRRGRRS